MIIYIRLCVEIWYLFLIIFNSFIVLFNLVILVIHSGFFQFIILGFFQFIILGLSNMDVHLDILPGFDNMDANSDLSLYFDNMDPNSDLSLCFEIMGKISDFICSVIPHVLLCNPESENSGSGNLPEFLQVFFSNSDSDNSGSGNLPDSDNSGSGNLPEPDLSSGRSASSNLSESPELVEYTVPELQLPGLGHGEQQSPGSSNSGLQSPGPLDGESQSPDSPHSTGEPVRDAISHLEDRMNEIRPLTNNITDMNPETRERIQSHVEETEYMVIYTVRNMAPTYEECLELREYLREAEAIQNALNPNGPQSNLYSSDPESPANPESPATPEPPVTSEPPVTPESETNPGPGTNNPEVRPEPITEETVDNNRKRERSDSPDESERDTKKHITSGPSNSQNS